MATERDSATAANEQAAVPGAENEAAEVSELDLLKQANADLQHKLKSTEGRLRVAQAQAGDSAETEARMVGYVNQVVKTLLEEDDPIKRAEKLKEAGARQERERATASEITKIQPELSKIVESAGLDWETDENLSDARKAWDERKPAEALRLASLAAREKELLDKGYVTPEEIEQTIEIKLREARNSQSSVDSGSSTASAGTGEQLPTNGAELRNYLANARAQGRRITKDELRSLTAGALSGGR